MFATLLAVVVALVLGYLARDLSTVLRDHGWFAAWLDWLDARLDGSAIWRARGNRPGAGAAAAAGGAGAVVAGRRGLRPLRAAVRGGGAVPRLGTGRPGPRRRRGDRGRHRRRAPRRCRAAVAARAPRRRQRAAAGTGRRGGRRSLAPLVRGAAVVPGARPGGRAGVPAGRGRGRGRGGGAPAAGPGRGRAPPAGGARLARGARSEEHTSELQSREKLVCRPLLEK